MRIAFAAIVVGLCFGCHPTTAQVVAAILVGDTANGSIGGGVKNNISRMRGFLAEMVQTGGIAVPEVDVVGPGVPAAPNGIVLGFSCTNINRAVASLTPGRDDAVLFYYSGHGFKGNPNQTKFPSFDCSSGQRDDAADLSSVVATLTSKQPRLLIAIADACNLEAVPPTAAPSVGELLANQGLRERFRQLFLNFHGTIVMSAAVPGQNAWYQNVNPPLGGYFTNQLLKAISESLAGNAQPASWQTILAAASALITIRTQTPNLSQQPQYDTVNLGNR